VRRSLCLLVGPLLVASLVRADPLDKVTGTEEWSRAPESPEAEWKEWLRGRRAWRRAGRELRVQRAISQRLERLATGGGGLPWGEVRRVIEAGLRPAGVVDAPASPRRRAPGRAPSRGRAAEEEGHLEYRPDAVVPVERLDDSGQGVDDEVDPALQRGRRRTTDQKRGP
jgi:hypothetical protein